MGGLHVRRPAPVHSRRAARHGRRLCARHGELAGLESVLGARGGSKCQTGLRADNIVGRSKWVFQSNLHKKPQMHRMCIGVVAALPREAVPPSVLRVLGFSSAACSSVTKQQQRSRRLVVSWRCALCCAADASGLNPDSAPYTALRLDAQAAWAAYAWRKWDRVTAAAGADSGDGHRDEDAAAAELLLQP